MNNTSKVENGCCYPCMIAILRVDFNNKSTRNAYRLCIVTGILISMFIFVK